MNPAGITAALNYYEDGITPYMLFFKDGVVSEKYVSSPIPALASVSLNVTIHSSFFFPSNNIPNGPTNQEFQNPPPLLRKRTMPDLVIVK